jgi:hypothetical protein
VPPYGEFTDDDPFSKLTHSTLFQPGAFEYFVFPDITEHVECSDAMNKQFFFTLGKHNTYSC